MRAVGGLRRGTWVPLLLLSALLSVQARQFGSDHGNLKHASGEFKSQHQAGRQLRSSALCPQGCSEGGCVADSTSGGLRCNKCDNNLVVVKTTGLCGESGARSRKFTLCTQLLLHIDLRLMSVMCSSR